MLSICDIFAYYSIFQHKVEKYLPIQAQYSTKKLHFEVKWSKSILSYTLLVKINYYEILTLVAKKVPMKTST